MKFFKDYSLVISLGVVPFTIFIAKQLMWDFFKSQGVSWPLIIAVVFSALLYLFLNLFNKQSENQSFKGTSVLKSVITVVGILLLIFIVGYAVVFLMFLSAFN